MASTYTIAEISSHTGLKVNCIRRCMAELKDMLKPHLSKSDTNNFLFDDNALIIFREIAQLKANDNLSIPAIKGRLELPTTPVNTIETPVNELAIAYKELAERERAMADLAVDNAKLTGRLQLLTDGRDTDTVRQEAEGVRVKQELAKRRRAKLLQELKDIADHLWKTKRKLQIINELEALDE